MEEIIKDFLEQRVVLVANNSIEIDILKSIDNISHLNFESFKKNLNFQKDIAFRYNPCASKKSFLAYSTSRYYRKCHNYKIVSVNDLLLKSKENFLLW